MIKPRAIAVIEFSVAGVPFGQPRLRHRVLARPGRRPIAVGYTPRSDPVYMWRQAVHLAVARHLPDQPWPGLVRVRLDVFLPRPARLLKRSSPEGPIPCGHRGLPDNDNLEKAIWDALTEARLWEDDAQVQENRTRKYFAARGAAPGATALIELLADDQMGLGG